MEPHEVRTIRFVAVLLATTLLGLLLHRRDRMCRSFAAYCAAVICTEQLLVLWPETFFTFQFYSLKEGLYGLMATTVAFEIALLTFSEFPRARRLIMWGLGALLVLGVVVMFLPHGVAGPVAWMTVLTPRWQGVILALFLALPLAAAYYRVPVHPFHVGIIWGFTLYLGAYTGALTLVRELGPGAYPLYAALDPAAYAASVGVWVWAAWRRGPELSPEARRLQPWAV